MSDDLDDKVLSITTINDEPHDILKTVCQAVAEDEYEDCIELGKHMHAATFKRGVGLSANQVGVDRRVCIIMPKSFSSSYLLLINPVIINRGKSTTWDWEGCLSCPKKVAKVERHDVIDVEYIAKVDGVWKKVVQTFKREVARIVQHEMDHLDGKLIVDNIEELKPVEEAKQ